MVAAGDGTISLADYADTPTAGYRRKRREILRRYAPQDDGAQGSRIVCVPGRSDILRGFV